jgi:hypothetical protein
VVALVRAFLKAGILTELGDREETYAGTHKAGRSPNAREMSGSASVRGCSLAVTLSEVGLVGGPP